jgi:hypothetical protein
VTTVKEKIEIEIWRDAATGVVTCEVYLRDGKFHRDDGPAVIGHDPAAGTVTHEGYWRDGKRHRDDGPAVIGRDPATGTVTREAYWRNGVEIPAPPKPAVPPIAATRTPAP